MSLLGRLEDLSLPDIVQIVFLSRRTGILEIIDSNGRYTVLFRHGLIVNVSSPEFPDLASWLLHLELITPEALPTIRAGEEAGVPTGTAVLETDLMTVDTLAQAITQRLREVIEPLLSSRDGEFNFILSDSLGPLDIEYEADIVFQEGGVAPQKVIGGPEGEKIKPLRGLEETMRAGKALLRGNAPLSPPPSGSLGLDIARKATPTAPPEPPRPADAGAADDRSPLDDLEADESTVVAFPQRDENPFDIEYDDVGSAESLDSLLAPPPAEVPEPPPVPVADEPLEVPAAAAPPATRLRIAGSETVRSDESDRNLVLFERDPLVRVAARRAFTTKGFKTFQFGSLDETRTAISELFRDNHFFITFLELAPQDQGGEAESIRLLQSIKKRNRHLPVVVIDDSGDAKRRHQVLKEGADLYLTRPSEAHRQPGLVEEELALFADELVLFAEKAFAEWKQITGTFADSADVGRQFYDIARKEKQNRSFQLLKQLINELSNPDDINQISLTILHFATEYLDRAALFVVDVSSFTGIAGAGKTGEADDMSSRARALRISAADPSVLRDVATARRSHRGKLQRTDANVALLRGMGTLQPTQVVVIPIVHANQVVGVLYGDNGENRSPIDETTGLEIFLEQAGYAFGHAVIARRRHRSAPEEQER